MSTCKECGQQLPIAKRKAASLNNQIGWTVRLRINGNDESPQMVFNNKDQAQAWLDGAEHELVSEWIGCHGQPSAADVPNGWSTAEWICDQSEWCHDILEAFQVLPGEQSF